jgi:DNA-binding transcriptional regulator YiaG
MSMAKVIRTLAQIRKHNPDVQRIAAAAEDDESLPAGRVPMPAAARIRLKNGIPKAADVAAFRSMMGMSQTEFAASLGINLGTLRNWEQGRRNPEGPAIALLRLAARHPRLLLESLSLLK